jgi:SNF family Na+-dependent transporter
LRRLVRHTFIFLLGFVFGLATLITFRHELIINTQIETLVALLVAGGFLTVTILAWLMRLRRHSRNTSEDLTHTAEWWYFMWGSLSLLIIYLTLVIVFLDF